MSDISPAPPIDAASVILFREAASESFEIYLLRRKRHLKFMGGAYVFPGGKVDDQDRLPEMGEMVVNECQWPESFAIDPRPFFFAGIRETFEEACVLPGLCENVTDQGFEEYRRQIHQGEMTLFEMARRENQRFDIKALIPFSRWITPKSEKKRFDTRFFLARLPEGQTPRPDEVEMTDSIWLHPVEVLDKHRQGKLPLMPPTFRMMEELAEIGSLASLLDEVSKRDMRPVRPELFKNGGVLGLRLPNDPEYSDEDFRISGVSELPSRIILTPEGHWRSE